MVEQKVLTLTLAIIKPHVLKSQFAWQSIRQCIDDNGFNILRQRILHMDKEMAGQFYGEHKGKFFYQRLVEFMSSDPSEVLVLQRENAVEKWRELLGPTKTFQAIYSKSSFSLLSPFPLLLGH